MRLLWLLAATILSLVDASCFRSVVSAVPRMVVDKPTVNSEQACQQACIQNAQCLGYTYGKTCSLLGKELDSKTCAAPSTISIKAEGCTESTSTTTAKTTTTTGKTTTTSSTTTTITSTTMPTTTTGQTTTSSTTTTSANTKPTTTTSSKPEIGDGMTGDTCGTLVPGIQVGKSPICPSGNNYVIRAKDENSVMITLDNDKNKAIEWDEAKGMWRYFTSTKLSIYLTAASCTTADDSSCACQPLPMYDDTEGGIAALINQSPICPENDMYMWFVYDTHYVYYVAPSELMMHTIACRAGIWVLERNDQTNGHQILNATCYTF